MTAHTPAIWAVHLTALAACRAATPCPHCGTPRQIVPDNTTLPVQGLRLVACHCTAGHHA